MNFSGKRVLVVGTKRSGMAAIELLVAKGACVRAMDLDSPAEPERSRLQELGVPVLRQERASIGDAELIVLSPAVPVDAPDFLGLSIPVIGEVELASYFLKGPVIGITGSNGKTTTTALTGHILTECGIDCQVGGNIGTAITGLVDSSERWNVLELSSFQLETIYHFRAKIGACLNVTPDHLDRHHTFENYAAAKRRLFETQQEDDFAVLNFDDPVTRAYAEAARAQVYWFSVSQPVPRGASLAGEQIVWDGEPVFKRGRIRLRGIHNVENVLAAASMAILAGVAKEKIGAAVESFPGVEHRIEFLRELRGVSYYNDSKATNVDATVKAVDSFDEPLWIILGGKDKGGSYEPLRELLKRKAKGVLLIGAATPLIEAALGGIRCETLDRAVEYAARHAERGDVVLLSPACASFDQFRNYEHRGATFKQLVKGL